MSTMSSEIANEFLTLAKDDGIDITNLKLVKLMYIAQGLSLALLDKPLFDTKIEAWRYGPVVPEIYYEFKRFKSDSITCKSVVLGGEDWDKSEEPKLENEDKKKVVKLTWKWYKDISASRLVELTHANGTPWSLTYEPGENNVIENDVMRKYYVKFLKNISKD